MRVNVQSSDKPPKKGLQLPRQDAKSLGIDETTGAYTCPECHRLYNLSCGNCFHSRYKDEDPLSGPER